MAFKSVAGVRIPDPTKRLGYDFTRKKLKVWCEAAGWNASLFSTHSMKRGCINKHLACGVPDRFIMIDGRWRAWQSFEGYCDDEVQLQLRCRALREAGFRPD
eukprot:1654956-Rhodomonas_salina.1